MSLLVLLFGSFLQPITILVSLPLSIGGAIAALLLTHKAMSMPVVIGILMLMGIVTKNAIMLVDFAVEEIGRGTPRLEALVEAGHKRARPIIMTTIAMAAGMFPSALGLGDGGGFRSPMAIAVIGGLIASTLLSLVFVPAAFTLVDDVGRLAWRLFGRFVGDEGRSRAHERGRRAARQPRTACRRRRNNEHGVRSARPQLRQQAGQRRDILDHMVGVAAPARRGSPGRSAPRSRARRRRAPRRGRAGESPTIAIARRRDAKVARERQHHAGLGLAAVAGIVAGEEFDRLVEAERGDLPARARLGIVGGDAEAQAHRLAAPERMRRARRSASAPSAIRRRSDASISRFSATKSVRPSASPHIAP